MPGGPGSGCDLSPVCDTMTAMDTLMAPEDSQSQSSIGKKKSTQVISMLRKPFARKHESPVRYTHYFA
jgi:hypothetical protein